MIATEKLTICGQLFRPGISGVFLEATNMRAPPGKGSIRQGFIPSCDTCCSQDARPDRP